MSRTHRLLAAAAASALLACSALAHAAEGAKVLAIGPLAYPPQAQRDGVEGTVLVRVRVLATGAAGDALVARSSGHRLLDAEALRLARAARYAPALEEGVAVDAWAHLPIRFELREDAPAPKPTAPTAPVLP
jgi:protein TonB